MSTEESDIAVLKKQMEWVGTKVDRIDIKLDQLIESHTFFKGKVVGVSLIVSVVVALVIEVAKAMGK